MKITEDVRNYAPEEGIAAEEALRKGTEEKLKKSSWKRGRGSHESVSANIHE